MTLSITASYALKYHISLIIHRGVYFLMLFRGWHLLILDCIDFSAADVKCASRTILPWAQGLYAVFVQPLFDDVEKVRDNQLNAAFIFFIVFLDAASI